MANDFRNSVAQEDVVFSTTIERVKKVGDNMSRLMIFIEETRYIEDETAFIEVSTGIHRAIVTKDNFALVTKGVLKQWLSDLFISGATVEVHLVTFIGEMTTTTDWDEALLIAAYNEMAIDAYFKTILVYPEATSPVYPVAAVALATLCATDAAFSSAPLFPFITPAATAATDPIYAALLPKKLDAFMVAYADKERNGALLQLGITLSVMNGSGTSIGNNFDFVKTSSIASSGVGGKALSVTEQGVFKGMNIAYFKPVGDTTERVVLYGEQTINGNYVIANWIVAYCNYVNKVGTAQIITNMGTYRTSQVYNLILTNMQNTIELFTSNGSGRLTDLRITAPAFSRLPDAGGKVIKIPDAWRAAVLLGVKKVEVQGTLIIKE